MEQRFYGTDLLTLKMKINLSIPQTSELLAVSAVRAHGTQNSELQFLYPCTLLTSAEQTVNHLVI
jgi:hypothetical protein